VERTVDLTDASLNPRKADLPMIEIGRERLGALQRLLHLLGESADAHG
jgi:hypothetical protein